MEPYSDPSMMPSHLYYPQPMMGPTGYHQGPSSAHYPPYPGGLDPAYRPYPSSGMMHGMMPGSGPMGYMPPSPYDGMYPTPPGGYMPPPSGYTSQAPGTSMGPPTMMPPSTGSPSMMYPSHSPTAAHSSPTDFQGQQPQMPQFNMNSEIPTPKSMPRPPPLKRGVIRRNPTPPQSPAHLVGSPTINSASPPVITPSPVRMPTPPVLVRSPSKPSKPMPPSPSLVENTTSEGPVSDTLSTLAQLSKSSSVDTVTSPHSAGLSSKCIDAVSESSGKPNSSPNVDEVMITEVTSGNSNMPDNEVPSSDCPSTDFHWISNSNKMTLLPSHPILSHIKEGEDYEFSEAENKYSCIRCNYATTRFDKIEQHLLAHRGNLICRECGKAFIKMCDLERHMSAHITGRIRKPALPNGKARKSKFSSADVHHVGSLRIESVTGGVPIDIHSPNHSRVQNSDVHQATLSSSNQPGPESPSAGKGSDNDNNPDCIIIQTEADKTTAEKVSHAAVGKPTTSKPASTDKPSGGTADEGSSEGLAEPATPLPGEGRNGEHCSARDAIDVDTVNSQGSAEQVTVLSEKEIKKEKITELDASATLASSPDVSFVSENRAVPTSFASPMSIPRNVSGVPSFVQHGASSPVDMLGLSQIGLSTDLSPGSSGEPSPPKSVSNPISVHNQVAVPPQAFREAQGMLPRRDPQGRNFRCTLCSYSTRDSWHLEKHYLAHTRQYKICRYCGKAFERPSDLVRHHERHVKRMLEAQGKKASDFPSSFSQLPSRANFTPNSNSSPFGPPLRRLSSQIPLIRPFQGLTAPAPRPRKAREYFHCDMCNFKFISVIALKVHKKQVHNATVLRMDMYRKSVLTFTCLLEMEVRENNEVTIHPNLVKVDDMMKPDLQVPPVSDITDIRYIVDCAKRSGLVPMRIVNRQGSGTLSKSPQAYKSNLSNPENSIPLSVESSGAASPDLSPPPLSSTSGLIATPVNGIPGLEMFVQSTRKRSDGNVPDLGDLSSLATKGYNSDGILTSDMFLQTSSGGPLAKRIKQEKPDYSSVKSVAQPVEKTSMPDNNDPLQKEGEANSVEEGNEKNGSIKLENIFGNPTMRYGMSPDELPSQVQAKYQNCIYKCDKCTYATNFKHKLDQHLHAHRGRYICKVCGKAFIKTSDLTRHWPSHAVAHNGRMLKCDSCAFQTSRRDILEDHMKRHYCLRVFTDEITEETMSELEKEESAKFEHCEEYKQEDSEGIVYVTMPKVKAKPLKPGRKRNRVERPEVDYGFGYSTISCYCPDCGDVFRSARALSSHRYEEHNNDDDDDKEDLPNAEPKYCKYCKKEFKSSAKLKRHEDMHMSYGALERHRKGSQENKSRNTCPYCHNTFASKVYLKEHINIHTGEKPFECEGCHEKFAIRATMINHMKKFCGVKPKGRKKKRGQNWSQQYKYPGKVSSTSTSDRPRRVDTATVSIKDRDDGAVSDADSDATIPLDDAADKAEKLSVIEEDGCQEGETSCRDDTVTAAKENSNVETLEKLDSPLEVDDKQRPESGGTNDCESEETAAVAKERSNVETLAKSDSPMEADDEQRPESGGTNDCESEETAAVAKESSNVETLVRSDSPMEVDYPQRTESDGTN